MRRRPLYFRDYEMKQVFAVSIAAWLCSLGLFAQSTTLPQAPRRATTFSGPDAHAATQTVKQYCAGCHSDRAKAGDLSLAEFDVARASEHPEIAEKMIRKLRVGMM